MKKKIIGIVAAIVTVVVLAAALVACNPYKQASIGAGDSSAAAQSNGGYVVRQGKYVYFINGYVGEDSANDWGVPVKQGIVRAEVDENGAAKPDTAKLLVPKSIYNSSTNGGIAVYGNWVYYATPSFERDKNGNASTTDTDFMRTSTDGSVTQLIGRIASRSSEYMFTSTRVLYYLNNAINYIDFSGMKANKPTDKGKGAVLGTLVDNVASMTWDYASQTIYYVRNVTGEDSYKNYNELCSIKADGTSQQTLATQTTFLGEGEKAEDHQQKVFKYSLVDMYVEADGTVTIYYNKTYHLDSDKNVGLYMAKATDKDTFKSTEKLICGTNSTTIYPLGYSEGALVNLGSNGYLWLKGDDTDVKDAVKLTQSSQTVWMVDQTRGYVYFSATSSPTSLLKISYKASANAGDAYVKNAVSVIDEGINSTPLKLDFVGDEFYFFATDDDNYMHFINLLTFDKTAKDEDGNLKGSEYVGVGHPVEEE